MTIREYLLNDDRIYRYIGTIWGNEKMVNVGRDIAVQLINIGYGEEEIVDSRESNGFYISGRRIFYKNEFLQETVLKLVR